MDARLLGRVEVEHVLHEAYPDAASAGVPRRAPLL